jgi:hypothetical protein
MPPIGALEGRRGVMASRTGPAWLTASTEYEGVPMMLRVRPGADAPALKPTKGDLVTVTHHLQRCRPNGLPEPDYNDGLASFDHELIAALEAEGGLCVVVETLAGRRSYYAYTKTTDDTLAKLRKLCASSGASCEVKSRRDADWTLYETYRQQFRF